MLPRLQVYINGNIEPPTLLIRLGPSSLQELSTSEKLTDE